VFRSTRGISRAKSLFPHYAFKNAKVFGKAFSDFPVVFFALLGFDNQWLCAQFASGCFWLRSREDYLTQSRSSFIMRLRTQRCFAAREEYPTQRRKVAVPSLCV
jgi:hypothetical protein